MNDVVPNFWNLTPIELKLLRVICQYFEDTIFVSEDIYSLQNILELKRSRIYQLLKVLEKKRILSIDKNDQAYKYQLRVKPEEIKRKFHNQVDNYFEIKLGIELIDENTKKIKKST